MGLAGARTRPRITAALLVVVLVSGCDVMPGETSPPAAGRRAGPVRPGVDPAERAATRPGPRVENSASGRSRRLIGRAVRDLKRLGLWERLTGHLYSIYLSARDGVVNVPDDGHLADALLTAQIDERGSGALCDIRFYPAAIARDLRRQRRFHRRGLLGERPPTLRHLWASILGHELAHCMPHPNPSRQRGERWARRWEARVIEAARGAAGRG